MVAEARFETNKLDREVSYQCQATTCDFASVLDLSSFVEYPQYWKRKRKVVEKAAEKRRVRRKQLIIEEAKKQTRE